MTISAVQTRSSLFSVIKNPVSLLVILGLAFLLFDLQFALIAHLPGIMNGNQCLEGGHLTFANLLFISLSSLLLGLFFVGFAVLIQSQKKLHASSLFSSGIGGIAGTLTLFCTTCVLAPLSLFGFSFGLTLFSTYNLWFKLISLVLILIGLQKLNRQLSAECASCTIN